jgi:hypothetical protein
MKTLKEIARMNPLTYKIIDSKLKNGGLLFWSDRIEITISGKHERDCTRKGAYKYGLCMGVK